MYEAYIEQTWQNINKGLDCGIDMFVNAGSFIVKGKEKEKISFDCIKFRDEYWDAVKSILKDNKNIAGIHIRRTDHNIAIAESRTEDFIRYMDKMLEENEAMSFFLATDDKLEENRIKDTYGSKIITMSDKVWGRDSRTGMKCGIVDLLCLSQCRCVLGSYESVFSQFAAAYGKVRLIICTSDNFEGF